MHATKLLLLFFPFRIRIPLEIPLTDGRRS